MRILIAGVGNVFLGDDGFGVEVVRRIQERRAKQKLPEGTTVSDFGIRGVHLAFELLSPLDLLVLVDATSRAGVPGTLYLIDIDPEEPESDQDQDQGAAQQMLPPGAGDAHAMDPYTVLRTVQQMGGTLPRTRIVGCEPADLTSGMCLSEPVREAIEPAIAMIRHLLESEVTESHETHASTS